MKIVEFIKTHKENWREALAAAPYALKIKEKDNLVLFNYNQIESDPCEEIVKEARGLILEKESWDVVRYGFRRFMNLGERGCDELDWESVGATSKEDGTLIFVYYYNGWHVGTRNTFDAEEAEINSPYYKNFGELFYDVAAQHNFKIEDLPQGYTFCLELCSKFNKVVLNYEEPKLFHILTRNNTTLEEVSMDIGLPKPRLYMLSSEKDYMELVESFDETHEGIVLRDKNNNRAKLKSQLYFQLHKMINNYQITPEIALEKIMVGEDKELICYFPELKDYFGFIQNEYLRAQIQVILTQQVANEWKELNPFANRKDYAFFVKDRKPQILYFKAYDNKAEEWFNSLAPAQLVKIFKIGG